MQHVVLSGRWLIDTQLDYCNSLFSGLDRLFRLQSVLRVTARLVLQRLVIRLCRLPSEIRCTG